MNTALAGGNVAQTLTSAAFGFGTAYVGGNIASGISGLNLGYAVTSNALFANAISLGTGMAAGNAVSNGLNTFVSTNGDLDAAGRSSLMGAGMGFALGSTVGFLQTYSTLKAQGFNPLTGKSKTETIAGVESGGTDWDVVPGEYKRSSGRTTHNANIFGGKEAALKDWNNIRQQYGLDPVHDIGSKAGFETTLGDGSTVTGSMYYGGNSNSAGWNIKVYQTPPMVPNVNAPKLPQVFIRYK